MSGLQIGAPRKLLLVPALVAAVALTAVVAPEPASGGTQTVQPLHGVVIAIDPGHQLGNARHLRQINRDVWVSLWKPCNTTGTATNSGFPEATFTWRLAKGLRNRLEALGATVRMTRSANSDDLWGPCVDARGRFGAKVGADVMISLHGDGAPRRTHGFVVIRPGRLVGYTDDIARPSRRLARRVHGGLLRAGFRRSTAYGGDGYDVRRDLGTLNMSNVPVVLVELGNMRNRHDAHCMKRARCRGRYAAGLTSGLRRFLR